MLFRFKKLLLGTALIASATMLGTPAKAQSFNDAQKGEIETIIQDYISENPEIIIEAFESFREKQERDRQQQMEASILKYQDFFSGEDAIVVGNPEGAITVVEFFDYNCGYCKRALPDVQAVLDSEEDVRVVLMEMPILGPPSLEAAKWAMAAKEQGQYFEYHQALMELRGAKNEENFVKIGEELGLDIEQLKSDAASQEIQEQINESVAIARDIGIGGTPAFIVGERLYPGYLGEEGLKSAIADARAAMAEDN